MKKRKRLIYQLFPSYLVITLVSLFAVSWYALSFTRQFYLERTQVDLEISGRLLEKQVARLLTPLDAPAVDRLCKDAAGQTVTRVTVILLDGRVVGDSEEMPANMASHLDREEVRDAYLGKVGVRIRHSDTLKQDMMYVALPLYTDHILSAVLQTSIPVIAIDERLGTIRWRISLGALLIAMLASLGSWHASRKITRPLEKMRDGARQFATGVLTHRLPLYDVHEFSALAETMNQMAEQLQHRLEEITDQRNKTDAVLSSMHEGVIATDLAQRVISINRAAAAMFGVSAKNVHGRSVLEVIRNHEFQSLMTESVSIGESLESDIAYHQNGERTFNVHCTPLLDTMQKRMGGLLDNAIKYSPEKSVIHIQMHTVDEKIQIHFTDQGVGIAQKHLPRLFERFYRVDKARSRQLGGTGLGLAIVKQIAQAHGGSVSVKSELAKGSTFTLHLPIQQTR